MTEPEHTQTRAITADMIERGAMALRDVVGNRSGFGKPWDELFEPIKNQYRREAEAVLRAVLELKG